MKWRFVRPGLHVNDETGIELRRSLESDELNEHVWDIWTANQGKPLGTRDTLNAAKERAAWIVKERPSWLH